MPPLLNSIVEFVTSPGFGSLQLGVIVYAGLLWLAIIIWVTRDVIMRSTSLIFQSFAILINIAVPILGVLLYLIMRPSKTNAERYYEEMEHRLLMENADDKSSSCEKCLTLVDKHFAFCPNCGSKIKKTCPHCHKAFPSVWNICPYCGNEHKGGDDGKKPARKLVAKAKKDTGHRTQESEKDSAES